MKLLQKLSLSEAPPWSGCATPFPCGSGDVLLSRSGPNMTIAHEQRQAQAA